MEIFKQYKYIFISVAVAVAIIVVTACIALRWDFEDSHRAYTWEELGVTAPEIENCEFARNIAERPVSVSYGGVSKLPPVKASIKDLIAKYGMSIKKDYSYGEDSIELTLSADVMPKDFFTEMETVVTKAGGTLTDYETTENYSNSSPSSECREYFQQLSVGKTEMKVVMNALSRERDLQTLSLLNQALADIRGDVQRDVDNINYFYKDIVRPEVEIYISGSEKDAGYYGHPVQ